MLDLSKNYVHFVARILKPDGTPCQIRQNGDDENVMDGDLVFPINMLGKTFFR
uniref:Uncharacterized protein n=1 Tax=Romanomermis culicivorax TaxID=13658 RepID=A0A915J8D5_ROMCU